MLNLKIEEQGGIELPDWISGTSLTLEEIGTIVAFACLRNGTQVPESMERMKSPEVTAAIVSLKEKGVLKASITENKITVDINLEAVLPASLVSEKPCRGNDFLNIV